MIREMDLDIEDFRIEEKDENYIEVYTKHIVNGYSTELTLMEESSGTKKLFGLLPKIYPVLLRYVITLFNDMKVNKNGAVEETKAQRISGEEGNTFVQIALNTHNCT